MLSYHLPQPGAYSLIKPRNGRTFGTTSQKAIRDLVTAVPEGELRLHVLVKPDQAPGPLKAHLESYILNEFPDDAVRLDLQVVNYSALP